jgi:hypothetical protein
MPRATVRKTIILIEVFYDIPHTTKANFGILFQISPRPLLSFFPIHYSPVFLQIYIIYSELLTGSLNKLFK